MVVRESPTVEYKESVTPTFLKTVSAYANYGTGKIEFGVNDEGMPSVLQIRLLNVCASKI